MNERIKQLADQAMNYATDRLSQTHGSGPDFVNDFREKFAELIVRECMKVAATQRNPANLNYKPSERFVEDLRQHFGIEE